MSKLRTGGRLLVIQAPTTSYGGRTSLEYRLNLRKTALFHSTNEDWNYLRLNLSWVIGSLNFLFKESNARYADYWERYYFRSGEARRRKLISLSEEKRKLLEDFTLPYTNPSLYKQLSKEEKELNTHYGRTMEDLKRIGNYFYEKIKDKPRFKNLSRQLCHQYVIIRAVDETFIGFQRELKTLSFLQYKFPTLTFQSVSHEVDVTYAVDAEVYKEGKLLFALQIKSIKYLNSHQKILKKFRDFNKKKNQIYEEKFNAPIYYIYSSANGYVKNREILKMIESYT